MKKQRKITKLLKNYIKRTWRNKLIASLLFIIGYVSMSIAGDATAFVFILLFAIPLFFANKDFSKYE